MITNNNSSISVSCFRYDNYLHVITILLLLLLIGAAHYKYQRDDIPFIGRDPTASMSLAAISLVEQGTISAPQYQQIYEELLGRAQSHPTLVIYQEYFSIGKDESTLYPKHSLLAIFVNSIFYFMFGTSGFAVATVVTFLLFNLGIYTLLCQFVPRKPALFYCLALYCVSPLLGYSWGFLYELMGFTLVIWSVTIAKSSPLFSGLLLGLSLWIRITHLMLFPLCFLLWSKQLRSLINRAFTASGGLLLAYAPLAVLNYLLWGDPLRGGYSRLVWFADGGTVVDASSHSASQAFSWHNFTSELYPKLFGLTGEGIQEGLNIGLLTDYPFAYLIPLVVVLLFRQRKNLNLQLIAAFGLTYLSFMLSYGYWLHSAGNRFAIPSLLLLYVCVVYYFEQLRLFVLATWNNSRTSNREDK